MKLTKEEVEKIATLGRLNLTEQEAEVYASQLSKILEYAQMLEELDVSNVEPTMHVEPVANVFREDEARPSWPVENATANAPDRQGHFFGAPKIIDA